MQLLGSQIWFACRYSITKRRFCNVPQPAFLCHLAPMWTVMMMAGRLHWTLFRSRPTSSQARRKAAMFATLISG